MNNDLQQLAQETAIWIADHPGRDRWEARILAALEKAYEQGIKVGRLQVGEPAQQQPRGEPWTVKEYGYVCDLGDGNVLRFADNYNAKRIADAHNATLVTTTEYAKGWDDHVAAVKAGIGADREDDPSLDQDFSTPLLE
jgi:hypothetical protein